MGAICSCCGRHYEKGGREDGVKVQRLWAYNSTSGGRYVFMKTTEADGSTDDQPTHVVAASAEAEGPILTLTDIQWDKVSRFQEKYLLKFEDNGAYYTVSASENGVTASQDTNGATTFHLFHLSRPNRPYVVLKSNSENDLYLSSDGAGNMKLKAWNLPDGRSPPGAGGKVDPAFLFRLVRPS